ncbi:MAG: hypothetical protein AAF913_01820 [Pseudomonadota bacterium]
MDLSGFTTGVVVAGAALCVAGVVATVWSAQTRLPREGERAKAFATLRDNSRDVELDNLLGRRR